MTNDLAAVRAACVLLLSGAAAAQIPAGGVEQQVKLDAFTPGLVGQLSAGDRFGRAVATVRDLNNDGNGDIVVGAPWDDDGGSNRGAAWILFLDEDASILQSQKISSTSGGFDGVLTDGANFGNAVTYLGDLDGNGTGEIAVASIGDDDEGANAGAVWILSLRADGTVEWNAKLTVHLDPGDRFGRSVAGMPDIDGDGVLDLAVGASGDDDANLDAGCVYLITLNQDGSYKEAIKITQGQDGFTGVLSVNDRFGQAAAAIGDLNKDGVNDLAVGAWLDDAGGGNQGALWILLLGPGGVVKQHVKLAEGLGGFDGVMSTGDQFGGSVTSVGDVNGDSVTDLAVGAYFDDDGATNAGAVWILFMNDDATVASTQKISSVAGGFGGDLDSGDRFAAVAAVEDLDGDGTVELGVGAMGDDALGAFTGAAWLLFLHASEWVDLGFAVPGALGAPQLTGNGTLEPKTEVVLQLVKGTPLVPVMLVIGASALKAPFAGGVLVPTPDVILQPGSTSGNGSLPIKGRWPPETAPGTERWFQAWMPDASAVGGWAASNGLLAVSP